MPSNHLILCQPRLLLPSIFPSIGVFSDESALHIRQLKYWSFSFNISPSNEHLGLVSFRMDWLDLPCSPRDSQESFPTPQFRSIHSFTQSSVEVVSQRRHGNRSLDSAPACGPLQQRPLHTCQAQPVSPLGRKLHETVVPSWVPPTSSWLHTVWGSRLRGRGPGGTHTVWKDFPQFGACSPTGTALQQNPWSQLVSTWNICSCAGEQQGSARGSESGL